MTTYKVITKASDAFFSLPGLDAKGKELPTENRVQALVAAGRATPAEVAACAARVRPLCHPEVMELCGAYLEQQKRSGTPIERRIFANMDNAAFLERLLTKRPPMFMGANDKWVLRDGSSGCGFWEELNMSEPNPHPWVKVLDPALDPVVPWDGSYAWARAMGPPADGVLNVQWGHDGSDGKVPICQVEWHQRPPQLTMENYLSYHELQLSALLSMVVPTHFVNDGRRDNDAVPAQGDCQRMGIYIAQVGCRFKKQDVQEYELLLTTQWQNTESAGFGWQRSQETEHPEFERRKLWAQLLWKKDSFPTYDEACSMYGGGRFLEVNPGVMLDVEGLRRRLTWVIEPFLLAADLLAGESNQQAYVHCVGLGLGVWLGDCKSQRGELEVAMQQLKAYVETLRSYDFPHVAVVDLSWFPSCLGRAAKHEPSLAALQWHGDCETEVADLSGRNIKLKLSQRNPADKLPVGCLLVAQYAWDGNAYPGNEYWEGSRHASGDSAAACCSTIGELQNPAINPGAFKASRIQILPTRTCKRPLE